MPFKLHKRAGRGDITYLLFFADAIGKKKSLNLISVLFFHSLNGKRPHFHEVTLEIPDIPRDRTVIAISQKFGDFQMVEFKPPVHDNSIAFMGTSLPHLGKNTSKELSAAAFKRESDRRSRIFAFRRNKSVRLLYLLKTIHLLSVITLPS